MQQVVLEGRTLTVVFTDGTQQAYTTQDTTELTAMTGVLRTANGGTGLDRAITAADVGAVEKGSGDYLKGNRGNYRLRIEQRGEWKGLTVCAPLAHPRRKRGHAGGKRCADRSGGGNGSARCGLHHI